jgi:hypothetical protein
VRPARRAALSLTPSRSHRSSRPVEAQRPSACDVAQFPLLIYREQESELKYVLTDQGLDLVYRLHEAGYIEACICIMSLPSHAREHARHQPQLMPISCSRDAVRPRLVGVVFFQALPDDVNRHPRGHLAGRLTAKTIGHHEEAQMRQRGKAVFVVPAPETYMGVGRRVESKLRAYGHLPRKLIVKTSRVRDAPRSRRARSTS